MIQKVTRLFNCFTNRNMYKLYKSEGILTLHFMNVQVMNLILMYLKVNILVLDGAVNMQSK